MGLWACWFSVLSFLVFLFVTSSPVLPSVQQIRAPSRSLTPASASLGVFVCSSLSYLALSGSGQETRSWPPVRARPTPKQQLALKGEAGESVRPLPFSLLAFISLSVRLPVPNQQV